MITRALIVTFAIMNVGISLWWVLQPDPKPEDPIPLPAGAAQLELVPLTPAQPPSAATRLDSKLPAVAATTPSTAPPMFGASPQPFSHAQTPSTTTVVAADATTTRSADRCYRITGLASEREASLVLAQLHEIIHDAHVHSQPIPESISYRVLIPSGGDRAIAEDLAKRIAIAGVTDWYFNQDDPNNVVIVLGQYRRLEGAQRRQVLLNTAGFAATITPSRNEATRHWALQLRSNAPLTSLKARLKHRPVMPLDCQVIKPHVDSQRPSGYTT